MSAKILIIDDEADIREMISKMLIMEGYRVTNAADGQEGLDKLSVESPDLIISDMKMPRKSGLDVIMGIKEAPDPVDVIILTGHSDETTAIECLRAGAYAYLVKPLEEIDVLLVAVERALHKRRLDLENQALLKKLEELSTTDPLTQLYNYRYLCQRLEDDLVRAKRYQQPLSLLMLDVDHFKKVNDRYGHPFGDVVLQKISALLVGCTRDADLVARYAGEAFCLLLPETSAEGASQVMKRILEVIREAIFDFEGQTARVRVSIGGAAFPEHGPDSHRLFKTADQALYTAKETGRDRVCWAVSVFKDEVPKGGSSVDEPPQT